jgi:antitoxin component YwqK of YwqJK toxin-antitoxin module
MEIKVESYPDGIPKSISYLEEKKLQGSVVEYYDTGFPKLISTYIDNKLDGIRITYFRNGNIATWGKFVLGKATGVFKTYFENGSIKNIKNCIEGMAEGWQLDFYENTYQGLDNKESLYNFSNIDKSINLSQFSFIKTISFMENNIQNGLVINFDEEGNTTSFGEMKGNLKKDGWTKFNNEQEFKIICNFNGIYLKEKLFISLESGKTLLKEEYEINTDLEVINVPKNDLIDFDINGGDNLDVEPNTYAKLTRKTFYNQDGSVLKVEEFK